MLFTVGLLIAKKIFGDSLKAEQWAKPIGYTFLAVVLLVLALLLVLRGMGCYTNRQIDKKRSEIQESKSKTSEAKRTLENTREQFDRGLLINGEKKLKEDEKAVKEAEKKEFEVIKKNAKEFPSDWEKTKEKWCSQKGHEEDCK